MKKSSELVSCCPLDGKAPRRECTDKPIQASPAELESIKLHLAKIEKLLQGLFGPVYSHAPESLRARYAMGDLIERHFEGIVREWQEAIATIFGLERLDDQPSPDLCNALLRFIAYLRDPDDLRTYIYLRAHCQQGMLSRAQPSEFNTIHIALKQVILKHVREVIRGRKAEILRDVVVASIDERRLMVSWFYIESRESALRASEEKYRNSINHAPDPMYEIDPDTFIVTSANSAAEKLHATLPGGEAEIPLVGRPIYDFVNPEMREGTIEHLRTVVHNGSDQAFDLPLGPYFVDVNSALITYGDKRFIHMILHDVTHRREIMDELLKAERLAAAGTFAAGVAHEVNNPLASISSLVQSLLSGEEDGGRRTTLHTILSQITRISGILKDLVNFARPSTAQRKAVDLNQLITETLRLVSYNKRFHGIKVEAVLAPDLKYAYADDNEIQQVLLNLLFNAADATQHPGGEIRIVTLNYPIPKEKRHKVIVKVVDNGIGISRENLKRVFDPFFTTKPAGAGVGLGLAMCQRIIMANGGAVKIESEVGAGTSVILALPVVLEQAQQDEAAVQ